MATTSESLDFLALLDEVAEDTVNRLVRELAPAVPSSFKDSREALDILSMCDSTSSGAGTMSAHGTAAPTAAPGSADDKPDSEMAGKQDLEENGRKDVKNEENGKFSAPDTTHPPASAGTSKLIGQPAIAATPEAAQQCRSLQSQSVQSPAVSAAGAVSQSKTGTRRKSKRQRWLFTKAQKQELDTVFSRTMYPSRWRMMELSTSLGIPVATLRVWFQNRRWRLRKSFGLTGSSYGRTNRSLVPDDMDLAPSVSTASNQSLMNTVGSDLQPPSTLTAVTTTAKPEKHAGPKLSTTLGAASTASSLMNTAGVLFTCSPSVSRPASAADGRSQSASLRDSDLEQPSAEAGSQFLGNGHRLEEVGKGLGYGVPPAWSMPLYWPPPQFRFPIHPYALPWQALQSFGQPFLGRAGSYPFDTRPSSMLMSPSFTGPVIPSPASSPYGKLTEKGEKESSSLHQTSRLHSNMLWPDVNAGLSTSVRSSGLLSTAAVQAPCLCRVCLASPPTITPPFFPWPGYCSPSALLHSYPLSPSPMLPTPPSTPSNARTTPPAALLPHASPARTTDDTSQHLVTPPTSTLSDDDVSPRKSSLQGEIEFSPSSPELDITSSVDY